MSGKSTGKGRALLAYVGLTTAEIEMCYADHPHSEEEAVQTGLKKWIESEFPKNWRVLIGAMEFAEIAMLDIRELKEELMSQKGMYMCVSPPECGCSVIGSLPHQPSMSHVAVCQSFSVLTFMHGPAEEKPVGSDENRKPKVCYSCYILCVCLYSHTLRTTLACMILHASYCTVSCLV